MSLFALLLAPAIAVAPADAAWNARCSVILHERGMEDRPEDEGMIPIAAAYYFGRLSATHDAATAKALIVAARTAVETVPAEKKNAEELACMDKMLQWTEAAGL